MPLLRRLLLHPPEDAAVPTGLFLQSQVLPLRSFLHRPLLHQRVLVPFFLVIQQFQLGAEFSDGTSEGGKQEGDVFGVGDSGVVGEASRNGRQHLLVLSKVLLGDQVLRQGLLQELYDVGEFGGGDEAADPLQQLQSLLLLGLELYGGGLSPFDQLLLLAALAKHLVDRGGQQQGEAVVELSRLQGHGLEDSEDREVEDVAVEVVPEAGPHGEQDGVEQVRAHRLGHLAQAGPGVLPRLQGAPLEETAQLANYLLELREEEVEG